MAATVSTTLTPSGAVHSMGEMLMAERTVTMDSTYPTGGEILAASSFGLRIIKHAFAPMIVSAAAAGAAGIVSVDPIVQTDGTVKIKVRVAVEGTPNTVAEAANNADVSGLVIRLAVAGV